MKFEYIPKGTCSRLIEIEVENDVIKDLRIKGGCSGNLQGVAALCRGRKVGDVAEALRGIRCGDKLTSCPDQIGHALEALQRADSNQ